MGIWRAFVNSLRYIRSFWQHPAKTQPAIRYTFNSSFIQSWYCQNWDLNRWLQEYGMLQKIGINEIIIQDIADTKAKHAVYPTKMEGYTSNTLDMVETALKAAVMVGMKVRIGLGFSNDWWVIIAFHPEWLINEARVNQEIVSEIVSMYGSYESLTGWYIPYEFHQFTALGRVRQGALNKFFRDISGAIKLNSDKNIMVAPFYNSLLSLSMPLASWSTTVYKILSNTGIDILALQDSIGADFNTVVNIDEIFRYTKKATDSMGMSLYAITETFGATLNDNHPASFNRIKHQMAIEAKYVLRFVAFSINHYQNRNEPLQVTGYDEYQRHYLDHAAENPS